MNINIKKELMLSARNARQNAYVPYSGFSVGAALLTIEGTIFIGANIENVSWGLTVCAERVAIYTAISSGFHSFSHMAIAAAGKDPVYPCGACRQVLWELAGDIVIIVSVGEKEIKTVSLKELLPSPFVMEGVSSPGEFFKS